MNHKTVWGHSIKVDSCLEGDFTICNTTAFNPYLESIASMRAFEEMGTNYIVPGVLDLEWEEPKTISDKLDIKLEDM